MRRRSADSSKTGSCASGRCVPARAGRCGARAAVARFTRCDPDDPVDVDAAGHPARRLSAASRFTTAVNSARLHQAFDELVGPGRWAPRGSLGTFPIRFPSPDDPGDDGWHVDASFAGRKRRLAHQRRFARARAADAVSVFGCFRSPMRRRGSASARIATLRDCWRRRGEDGLEFMELARQLDVTADRSVVLGDRRSRHRVPVPSVSRACRAAQRRRQAALHRATAVAAGATVPAAARRSRIIARSKRQSGWDCRPRRSSLVRPPRRPPRAVSSARRRRLWRRRTA